LIKTQPQEVFLLNTLVWFNQYVMLLHLLLITWFICTNKHLPWI